MKKEEARRAVVSEYDRWAKKHPNDARMMGGFLYFRYLQEERSDLLDFRAIGDDKWPAPGSEDTELGVFMEPE